MPAPSVPAFSALEVLDVGTQLTELRLVQVVSRSLDYQLWAVQLGMPTVLGCGSREKSLPVTCAKRTTVRRRLVGG
jgi:hypothetical protein